MDYLKRANDEILVITQVETQTAVDNLDEILKIESLVRVFIGPMDLAASMGYFGEASRPEVQAVIKTIEVKALSAGNILAWFGDWFARQR